VSHEDDRYEIKKNKKIERARNNNKKEISKEMCEKTRPRTRPVWAHSLNLFTGSAPAKRHAYNSDFSPKKRVLCWIRFARGLLSKFFAGHGPQDAMFGLECLPSWKPRSCSEAPGA